MNTMTDINGQAWSVGDLVLYENQQGRVSSIVSQSIVGVQFPGRTCNIFISGLTKLALCCPQTSDKNQEKESNV